MESPLLTVLATLDIYKDSAAQATKALIRNWVILIGSIGLIITMYCAMMVFAPFGLAGGLILGLVSVALLTFYYSWVSSSCDRETLTFKELLNFDGGLFFNVIGVAFILSIGDILFKQSFQRAEGLQWIPACFGLIIFLTFNSLPEVIHQHRRSESMASFSSALAFNKESWIEWNLPFLLLLAPALFINWQHVLVMIAGADVLLPVFPVIRSALVATGSSYLALILAVVLGNWYMLFRAFLFKELEFGTRRKRVYKMKNKG